MINRMYKFSSGISEQEKSQKIREIKFIMKQYPQLNINTKAYFDEDGNYVITVFEPSFIEKLKASLKKQDKKQNDEKQQLINWLEDKIKENEGIIQMSMGSLNEEFFDRKVQEEIREKLRSVIKECENKIDAFQEVLDFVNKGGKDE